MASSGLKDKVAIVSGASKGLGRAYALALAEAGAQVVALARSVEGDPSKPGSLAELVATGRAMGGKITAFGCDITNEASIVQAVQETIANFGAVDVLVNNAVWQGRGFKVLEAPLDDWENTMRVNVRGPYVFMRELVPQMIERGGGSIINITSASAGRTEPGTGMHDGLLIYGVSKAALERLTTYFAAHYRGRGVAVNAISPGHVFNYMQASGREPDRAYWGAPIVHLAQQRPAEGLTGEILHTYTYGRSWGPKPATPPQLDEHLVAILEEFGPKD